MGILSLSSETYEGRPALRLDAGPHLDIGAVEALASSLNEAVDGGMPLIVDASSVERMSTSAVQLFLAADIALANTDNVLALCNPSSTFMAAFTDCGVQPDRMNWTVTEPGDD